MSDNDIQPVSKYRLWFAILGALMIVQGAALVAQNYHFNHANTAQNNCVADKFAGLIKTLNARGDLANEISNNTETVILGVAASKTASDFERVLHHYQVATAKVKAERANNPYPPFPSGTCQ